MMTVTSHWSQTYHSSATCPLAQHILKRLADASMELKLKNPDDPLPLLIKARPSR